MQIADSIRTWARRIKRDAVMLWFAQRHPDTPLLARALAVLTVAYALSPIDLVPDFIPVLGYLDDAILLPAMIWLSVRLLPAHVVSECRARAEQWMEERKARPVSRAGLVLILLVWAGVAWLGWRWFAG